MGGMRMLAWPRKVLYRWDTPQTPKNQRGPFGIVLFFWALLVGTAVPSLINRSLTPFAYFAGQSIVFIVVYTRRHRRGDSRPMTPPAASLLTPSRPSDADDNPWRHPAA